LTVANRFLPPSRISASATCARALARSRCSKASRSTRTRATSCRSSAPPARASPPCCAASTCWRRRIPANHASAAKPSAEIPDGRTAWSRPTGARWTASAPARHGVPELQSLVPHDRAGKRHRGAHARAEAVRAPNASPRPRRCLPRSASRTSATTIRRISPAASSSAPRSRARWRCIRR
jgi:hypothetical protein